MLADIGFFNSYPNITFNQTIKLHKFLMPKGIMIEIYKKNYIFLFIILLLINVNYFIKFPKYFFFLVQKLEKSSYHLHGRSIWISFIDQIY